MVNGQNSLYETYSVPNRSYFNGVLDVVDAEDDGTLVEPLTLSDAKDWLKVDIDTDDDLITALIISARKTCEKFCNQHFIQREIEITFNNECGNFFFPYGPVDVSTIVLEDSEGTTIDEPDIKGTTFPRLVWPKQSNIKGTYDAGYVDLPGMFVTAIKEQLAYLYENRGEFTNHERRQPEGLSPMAKNILKPVAR